MVSVRDKDTSLKNRWTTLHAKKASLLTRCEQYAAYTLPHLFPRENQDSSTELPRRNMDGLGPRAVNHLANKVVTTLFRPQGPFFRLRLNRAQRRKLKAMVEASGADEGAVTQIQTKIDSELLAVEQEATELQDMVAYRPTATMAAQLLIITGNALIYHPVGRPVQCYSLRNYCVVRDISGQVIEIMLSESKSFGTFSDTVKDALRAKKQSPDRDYRDDSNVNILSQIVLEDDGKFHMYQEANGVPLDTSDQVWPKKKLPWIALTWNLIQGEDYGRGLVEDFAGAFNGIDVLTNSLVNIAAVMGDIKIFVNPASVIDVQALNESPPGSYHSGKPEDIGERVSNKGQDVQWILAMLDRYEKQIAQAFLLNSAVTRDAERVTAEEIRLQAQELETSNGGIYSRLALMWQVPTANVLLDQIGFDGTSEGIEPQIITGMDSLSRAGEIDNLRQWVADLTMLEAVPEDIRQIIDPLRFAKKTGDARQVDYTEVCFTQQELAAKQQQMQQMQQQAELAKAQGQVAAEAGKAAVQE